MVLGGPTPPLDESLPARPEAKGIRAHSSPPGPDFTLAITGAGHGPTAAVLARPSTFAAGEAHGLESSGLVPAGADLAARRKNIGGPGAEGIHEQLAASDAVSAPTAAGTGHGAAPFDASNEVEKIGALTVNCGPAGAQTSPTGLPAVDAAAAPAVGPANDSKVPVLAHETRRVGESARVLVDERAVAGRAV